MSTRATIKFTDGDETYYVYRHCDGFPDIVIHDIQYSIDKSNGRWSGAETGCLVTMFLALNYDPDKKRLPEYHISSGFAGDESYRYLVKWNGSTKEWVVNLFDY
jgi:hypothetical protein